MKVLLWNKTVLGRFHLLMIQITMVSDFIIKICLQLQNNELKKNS